MTFVVNKLNESIPLTLLINLACYTKGVHLHFSMESYITFLNWYFSLLIHGQELINNKKSE